MKKKFIILFGLLFSITLASCQGNDNNSISYSFTDPNEIEQVKTFNVNVIENEYITVSTDKTSGNKGEYVSLEITNIEPGYNFLGWYINDMFKGKDEVLTIQLFEDIQVETKYQKTERVSKIGFSVGGQMIRHVYTDYSLTLTQEMLDSVVSSISYLPYGYKVLSWKYKNGVEAKDGDIIEESLVLYPNYSIDPDIVKFKYDVHIDGGSVYNADTFEEANDKTLSLGTILTFTALDENGEVDNTKAWVNEEGEVYSYKSSFTMTLVTNLNLHTVDRSTLDTSLPILQSSDLFVERYLADTPHEYIHLRLYARVIIPLDYEYYSIMENYGAKMERVDATGHRQRATFPLNKSQWSVNGEAWCKADSQKPIYTYKGSSFIEFTDKTMGENGMIFNNAGWKEVAILSVG